MEILKPNNGSDIMVNFFYGSEKSRLSYKIDEGDWKGMSITENPIRDTRIPDNRYFLITNHIWLASDEKFHNDCAVTVRAVDRYGRWWLQSSRFSV